MGNVLNMSEDLRTLIYLEFKPDQIFYVNGFKTDVIEKHLVNDWQPTGLYALWDDFDVIFKKTTAIPESEKFYYPIVVSLWSLKEVFDQINLDPEIIRKVFEGQCKLLLVCPFEGWTWKWWDSLVDILKAKYGFTDSRVIYLSANYYPHDTVKTIVYNTWERQIFANYSTQKHFDSSMSHIYDTRPNKFICLNRRPSIHRYAVVTSMYDLKDYGILTCSKTGSFGDWYQNWVETNFLEKYPELSDLYNQTIKPSLPLTFDDGIDPETQNPAANEWGKIDKYYSSYLYIVTETYFEGEAQGELTRFLSEKIFKPMIFCQPFVAVARPGSLKLLQSLGYKTFGDYIDESYDDIVDDKQRLYQAVKSAKKFVSKSPEELSKIMIEMKPIFEHNYNRLKNRYDSEIYKNLIDDLNKGLQ